MEFDLELVALVVILGGVLLLNYWSWRTGQEVNVSEIYDTALTIVGWTEDSWKQGRLLKDERFAVAFRELQRIYPNADEDMIVRAIDFAVGLMHTYIGRGNDGDEYEEV